MKQKIQLFDDKKMRTVWDEDAEKWWFSIVDAIAILTESENPRHYWTVLKGRLVGEGNETLSKCERLKMRAADGKMRLTDVADTEQILRLVQSVPSKRAEPFKLWLAQVGSRALDEMVDPELSIERAVQNYRRLGYSESWINQRLKAIEVRKALTDEWDKSGVRQGREYALLTDLMSKTWSDMTTKQYRQFKGLKKENLRDNMTNAELVLNMLAEVSATDISAERQPEGYEESAGVAREGAEVARDARKSLESRTGRSAVSKLSARDLGQRQLGKEDCAL